MLSNQTLNRETQSIIVLMAMILENNDLAAPILILQLLKVATVVGSVEVRILVQELTDTPTHFIKILLSLLRGYWKVWIGQNQTDVDTLKPSVSCMVIFGLHPMRKLKMFRSNCWLCTTVSCFISQHALLVCPVSNVCWPLVLKQFGAMLLVNHHWGRFQLNPQNT